MRRFSIAALAGSFFVAFVHVACAADLPVKAKAPPIAAAPNHNWTGLYFGANIGGAWSDSDVNYASNDPLSAFIFTAPGYAAPPPASIKDSSLIGGLQLGYNWQFAPAWLVGLEADFDWSGIKGSATTTGPFEGSITFTNSVEQKVKWLGTVRGRLGYLPIPNLLTFVTGGFAYGRVEQSATYSENFFGIVLGNLSGFSFQCRQNVPCFTGSSSDTAVGWTVGGGIEYALWQDWTIRAEYLYVSLEGKPVTETATAFSPGWAPASFNANFGRTNLNIARFALNYRF